MSLNCLGDALKQNSINYKILKPGNKLNEGQTNFEVSILLIKIFLILLCHITNSTHL